MSRPISPLSYDTAASRPHRWVRRVLLLVAILIAVGFGSVWVGPLWRQSKLLYWQHRCLTHQPSGQRNPKEWDQFNQLASPPGIQSSGTLFLHELVSPAGHRRLVSVNLRRLIDMRSSTGAVDPNSKQGSPGSLLLLDTWIAEPARWPLTPIRLKPNSAILTLKGVTQNVPFDTGKVDPNDPSHFEITTGPFTPVVDGWLRDDDQIRLEIRQPK